VVPATPRVRGIVVPKLLQLSAMPDKAREPASGGGLEASAGAADPHKLKHFDRLHEPFDRHRTERGDLNETLGKT
jgi:hypothetical protein